MPTDHTGRHTTWRALAPLAATGVAATAAFAVAGGAASAGVAAAGLVTAGAAATWSLRRDGARHRSLQQRLHGSQAAHALLERRLGALTEVSAEVVWVLDDTGAVRYQSPSAGRVLGLAEDDVAGLHLSALLDDAGTAWLLAVLAGEAPAPAQLRVRRGDEGAADCELRATDRRCDDSVGGFVVNVRDVSQEKRLASELAWRADHDLITGLANWSALTRRTQEAMDCLPAESEAVAVLLVDLDGFKGVNDTFGHALGDELLRDVSARLRSCVRDVDLVARLGGDEFALLVTDLGGRDDAQLVAQRVLDRLAEPAVLAGNVVTVAGSVGVAPADGTARDAAELLRNADLALHQAKDAGRGQYAFYEPGLQRAAAQRLVVESELRRALEAEELVVHYQPTINLRTGTVHGVEALVRWHHPTRGVIPPLEFIPIAEDSDLICRLGSYVLARACVDAVRFAAHVPEFRVGVNVAPRQLRQATFAAEVRGVLQRTGLNPASLVLEITESAVVERSPQVLDTLRQLADVGVRIALDDFGTGYSSLHYLHQFRVDVIKVDRSFISLVQDDQGVGSLASTIVHMGHNLGMTTVAEGIETEAQRRAMAAMGCEVGQGFLFSPAVAADELERLLTEGVSGAKQLLLEARHSDTADGSLDYWSAAGTEVALRDAGTG